MTNRISLFILTISFIATLSSCKCDCTCNKNLGCKIAIAKSKNSGNIISTRKYCGQTNLDTDPTVADSVTAFNNRFKSDTISVTITDSIYKYDQMKKLTCKQADAIEKSGYGCECLK